MGSACLRKSVIAHALLVGVEIIWGLTDQFRPAYLLQTHAVQRGYDFSYLTQPQQVQLFFSPLPRLGGMLTANRVGHRPQMIRGMSPVHDR